MNALALVGVFGAILGAYTLIEDICWACSRRPMARPLSKRELRNLYRNRYN